ncbi:hypothetical protein ACFXI0_23875 [Kitasatospora indigofera]|uniref:hypothetical protein n=1 Tax=Kitasatospora indigofera TaxID=67307 RepID=UPI0036ADA200
MGSTIALLEAQLPAARERRGRLEEELAAAVARESAITNVLEGLRALSGTHLDGRAEPRDAVEAPVPDPAPDLALGPDGAAETVTSTSSVQATAADASADGPADGPAQDPAQDPADAAPVSAEPVAQPTARPARRTTGRSTATRAAAKRTTAAKRSTAGRKTSAGGKTTAGTAAPATSAATESQPGEVPAVVTVAKKRTRRSAPKAVPDAAPNDAGPGTVKKAAASAKKAAPAKAASRKAAPAKPVAKKVAPKKAVPATEAAPATVDAPAAATAAPVDAGPAKAASAPGRRRLADAEGVLAVLAQAQNPLRAREVAGLLGLDGAETTVNAIRTRLERLAKSGHAQRPGRGLYTVAADRPGTAG